MFCWPHLHHSVQAAALSVRPVDENMLIACSRERYLLRPGLTAIHDASAGARWRLEGQLPC